MRVRIQLPLFFALCSFALLLFFLFWHLRLGLVRYFDVDEYAHLHWASQIVMGRRPYIDFLTFFPPGFAWFLTPVFWFFSGTAPFFSGRVLAFGVFAAIVGTSMVLFWMLRRSWAAIAAGAILAFLPIPFDKYLEIRPDSLATFLAMAGMIFQIQGMREIGGKKQNVPSFLFVAGIFYGASLLVLPKVLPQVLVAVGVVIFMDVGKKISIWRHGRDAKYISFPFFGGLAIPIALFGLWALTLGNLDVVIYSLTTLPVEANKISQFFIMMPDLFFYPNALFYGQDGWARGLVVNHILWFIGLGVGIYRLVTPFLARGRDGVWEELLVSGTLFVQVIFYVLIVPLKHAQYLIPIGVLVAWYAADGIYMAWEWVKTRRVGRIAFAGVFVVAALTLLKTFLEISSPKLFWTNQAAMDSLTRIFATIPKDAFVLDLDGRTLYYRDPYYACCLPFGQFTQFLSRPLPPLSQALEQTKTPYIYQGELKRVTTLTPEDQAYINSNYAPWQAGDDQLLVRKRTGKF